MAQKKPNILFFGIDSLRRDHMSHYGYERLTTPHISKYAENGVTFEKEETKDKLGLDFDYQLQKAAKKAFLKTIYRLTISQKLTLCLNAA